jgi:uncharacterized protein involved in exopolysaccharide biosynthesis
MTMRSAPMQPVSTHKEPGLPDFWASARPYRRRIALVVLIGTVLGAVVAFAWPPSYKATVTILPPSEEETGFSVTSVLSRISVPGVHIPSRSGPIDITLSVLNSRRLASALVDRFGLIRVYHCKTQEEAIRKLKKRIDSGADPSGTVVASVRDRDPERAAQMANALIEELDRFNRDVRMTKGRRARLFVEGRIQQTRKDLAAAEQDLKDYQRQNKTLALDPDQASTVESGAKLFATQAALQVQVGLAQEYATARSEEVQRLQQQLDQVNREISSLPNLGMELARRMREVKIQEQVFALLSAQYEEARIDEARDVPTVEILDPAVPPDRPVWPRKGRLIAIAFGISLLGALGWTAWSVRQSSFLT